MIKFSPLSESELNKWLESHPDWCIKDNTLQARFTTADFRSAMALINMVATEAEVINHHPNYTHSFLTIDFSLSTHDADGRITSLDCKLASYISKAASIFN